MFNLKNYDETNPQSILMFAKQLIGHTFMDVLENELSEEEFQKVYEHYSNKNNKGGLGTFLEEHYFHYAANSNPKADFEEAEIELKASPYEINKNGSYKAGERLVLTMIQYDESAENDFYNSHLWKKCKNILLVYYLRNRSLSSNMLYQIDFVDLFTPPENDLKIIEQDYKIITDKIKAGKAHELSEGDTMYLGACTKGSTAEKSYREQSYPTETGEFIKAKSRAYSYKNSYMTYVLNNYILGKATESESIIKDDLKEQTFEEYLQNIISQYVGKSDKELCRLFNLDYTGNKAQWTTLAYKILGVKSNSAEELIKANISIRVIRLEENGTLKESLSLNPFEFTNIIKQDYEDSEFYNYFEEKKFLFVVFQKKNGNCILNGCQLWNMPANDLNNIAKDEWNSVVDVIKNGIKLTKVQQKDKTIIENNLPKKSQTKILHVRPHTGLTFYQFEDGSTFGSGTISNSDLLPDGRRMTIQSLWLNNSYILKQINDDLKS